MIKGKCIFVHLYDMMARFISKTLLRHGTASQSAKGVIVCHRHRSSEAWMEIDGAKLLEEHTHRIMVKKATPDWLPFLPGSSFWVPPPPYPFPHKLSFSFSVSSHNHSPPPNPSSSQVTVQLNLRTLSETLPLSEDDEG